MQKSEPRGSHGVRKELLLRLLIVGVVAALTYLTYGLITVQSQTRQTVHLTERVNAYHQAGTGESMLVVGDSIGWGTGATASENTFIGHIGRHNPSMTILNWSTSGITIDDARRKLSGADEQYDIVLLTIGSNDALRPYISLEDLDTRVADLLTDASRIGRQVVVVLPPDLAYVPFYPNYTRPLFSHRSELIIQALSAQASLHGAEAIPTTPLLERVPPEAVFASDKLHLNDDGNRLLAEYVMEQSSVLP